MSNLFKPLKRGVIAFFFGQVLTLWKKDSSFRRKVTQAHGLQKISTVFSELFSFNEAMIHHEKEEKTIQKTLDTEWQHLKKLAMDEKLRLDTAWDTIKEQIAAKGPTLKEKFAHPLLDDLHQQIDTISYKVRNFAHDIDEKYGIVEHFEEMKQKITSLRNSLPSKDSKDSDSDSDSDSGLDSSHLHHTKKASPKD